MNSSDAKGVRQNVEKVLAVVGRASRGCRIGGDVILSVDEADDIEARMREVLQVLDAETKSSDTCN